MDNMAIHMRISGVTITDSDVDSRSNAAKLLAAKWGKETTIATIVSKAADVAKSLGDDGTPPLALCNEVQAAIQKKASSFLYEERPLDVSICAGMAMISIMNGPLPIGGWTIRDVYATAVWSALTYQPSLQAERRENLRQEVLAAATVLATQSPEKARERSNVPNPSALSIKIGADNEVTDNFNGAITQTVEALRRNAALDREELDFLWWAQLGRSRLIGKQFCAMGEPTRIVAAGIEGANLLRRLPCEVHREIVLRTLDQDPELDLAELLTALGPDRALLSEAFETSNVNAHPTVFPLLHALIIGSTDESGAKLKRRVSEWGARALLEAGFSRLMSNGPGKL